MTPTPGETDRKLRQHDEDIVEIYGALTRIEGVQTQHTTLLRTIVRRLDGHDVVFRSVEQRFDAVGQRFNAVDERISAVDERFDGVDQRFNAVDERFDGVDGRLDLVGAQLGEVLEILRSDRG